MAAEKELDLGELAWAAGFFDGEGSFCSRVYDSKNRYQVGMECTIGQAGRDLPYVLDRFHKAIGGLGRIHGPYNKNGIGVKPMWQYKSSSVLDVIEIGKLLWPWLSPIKKEQLNTSLRKYYKYVKNLQRPVKKYTPEEIMEHINSYYDIPKRKVSEYCRNHDLPRRTLYSWLKRIGDVNRNN